MKYSIRFQSIKEICIVLDYPLFFSLISSNSSSLLSLPRSLKIVIKTCENILNYKLPPNGS